MRFLTTTLDCDIQNSVLQKLFDMYQEVMLNFDEDLDVAAIATTKTKD
jgi:hypothetical protein